MGRYAGIVVAPSIPINQCFADLSLRLNLHRDRIRIDLCIGLLPSLFPAAIATDPIVLSSLAENAHEITSRYNRMESQPPEARDAECRAR